MKGFIIAIVVGVVTGMFVGCVLFAAVPNILHWLGANSLILHLFLITLPSFLVGGYVAARFYPSRPLFVSGTVGSLLALLLFYLTYPAGEVWFIVPLFLSIGALSLLGGAIAKEKTSLIRVPSESHNLP